MTMQDLTVLYSDILQASFAYKNMEAVTTTPIEVNVSRATDSAASIKPTVPGLIIEWSYLSEMSDRYPTVEAQGKMYSLLVLSPDKNTGYAIYTAGNTPAAMPTLPANASQIFNSFELVS